VVRRDDYAAALAARPAAVRRHFTVFVRANGLPAARMGVIVGKKVAGRAVDRNRIKRLVREMFRQNRGRFAGNDLVFLARRCPSDDAWAAARGELEALFTQLAAQLSTGS
jgi:ribonuclease P protein component